MGPITLFDKSFLQSLSLDESVWFATFFSPVVCPLFYVETLADLEKAARKARTPGRTPEQEVRVIADKFPELTAYPCTHHGQLVAASLSGWPVPMNGQIPRSGGRIVQLGDQTGVVYENAPEAEAFARWQQGRFRDIERDMAKRWRRDLGAIDLHKLAEGFRELGIDGKACKSVDDARAMARNVVTGTDQAITRMAMALGALGVDPNESRPILENWTLAGLPPLAQFAPYAAHVVEVELFFQFALAANHIGAERASNRVDIAYLHYLPFSMMFVSSDKLHRRCAPHFLRDDQEFVWGPELKADLARINEYFKALPDAEKERGVMQFARAAPDLDGSIVRRLRARFMRKGYDDEPPVEPPPASDERTKELVDHLLKWKDAPEVAGGEVDAGALTKEPDTMSIQRQVPKRKGSWWLLPKDLPDEPSD